MKALDPRVLRIGTFVAQPTLLAGAVALRGDSARLLGAASVLVAMWVVAAGALGMRVLESRRTADRDAPSPMAHLDVLTSTGAAMLWLGVLAMFASVAIGWASLSVIGVLGIGVVDAAIVWVALAAGGREPWRRAAIERSILPAIATEREPLREEVRIRDVKIPIGTRLFAMGRTTPHTPITRYVVESEGSLADLKIGSELGPAPRGEHRVPPLALWIGDVLGLARTPSVHRGECRLSVVPALAPVEGVRALLGKGGDDAQTAPATFLPTEGTFKTREYVPGDDARRIHWVRSVNADKLIVRLPDEVPLAEPTVRLVLDTELVGVGALATRAPDDLLDSMVRVWLGVAKALADDGVRVILAAATPGIASAGGDGTGIRVVERTVQPRSREPLKLGARVAWQSAIPTATLVTRGRGTQPRQIVVSCRPRHLDMPEHAWIVVPERAWTVEEPSIPRSSPIATAFPMGSPENRLGRRRRERRRVESLHQERAYFSQVMCAIDWTAASGGFLARPMGQGRIGLQVIK